jgi:hypothetical protein
MSHRIAVLCIYDNACVLRLCQNACAEMLEKYHACRV